jgi:hypothetical protein
MSLVFSVFSGFLHGKTDTTVVAIIVFAFACGETGVHGQYH